MEAVAPEKLHCNTTIGLHKCPPETHPEVACESVFAINLRNETYFTPLSHRILLLLLVIVACTKTAVDARIRVTTANARAAKCGLESDWDFAKSIRKLQRAVCFERRIKAAVTLAAGTVRLHKAAVEGQRLALAPIER